MKEPIEQWREDLRKAVRSATWPAISKAAADLIAQDAARLERTIDKARAVTTAQILNPTPGTILLRFLGASWCDEPRDNGCSLLRRRIVRHTATQIILGLPGDREERFRRDDGFMVGGRRRLSDWHLDRAELAAFNAEHGK